jgi:hypothetical protein
MILRPCPHCLTNHPEDDQQPANGDFGLCIVCGEWCVEYYGALRKPTGEEYIEIATSKECRLAREAWVSVMKGRKAK